MLMKWLLIFFGKNLKTDNEQNNGGEFPAEVIDYASWNKITLEEAQAELKQLNDAIDTLK